MNQYANLTAVSKLPLICSHQIEYAVAKIDAGYNAEECNLFLCKGYQVCFLIVSRPAKAISTTSMLTMLRL